MTFKNREDAGRQLAQKLTTYADQDTVVYALPRGGVVTGYEIAKALDAPLDLIIVRKIGHQMNPEYAICVVAEDGHLLCNEHERAEADSAWFEKTRQEEQEEAKRRRETYLKGISRHDPRGKTAILVDDGIATGLTIKGAVAELRHARPKKLIVAVPVAPSDTASELKKQVDELVAIEIPEIYLGAVGAYYQDFPQTTDEEVIELLSRANK